MIDPEVEIPVPERFRSADYRAVVADAPAAARVVLPAAARETMKELACAGYPEEVCGLLIGTLDDDGWLVEEARAVANRNRERAGDRFELDPDAYRRIDRGLRGSGKEIIGVFHSHPDCPARPSPTDLAAAWEGFLYPIVSVCGGRFAELRCWSLDGACGRFRRVERVQCR